MDGSSNQFLASAGFTCQENRRVCRGNFGNCRKHLLERRRRAHDLLEHRGAINLLAQDDVLALEPLLRTFAVVYVGSCSVPADDTSALIP